MSDDYYELTFDDRRRDIHVAMKVDPSADYQSFKYRLRFEGGVVDEWPDMRYVLPRGAMTDWIDTVNNFSIVSERIRSVLDAHAGPNDRIQWIPAHVRLQEEEERPYWLPHFPDPPDVLHRQESTWGPGGVIRWVLDPARMDSHEVLRAKDVPSMAHLVVSERVLAALLETGADGFVAQRARMVR